MDLKNTNHPVSRACCQTPVPLTEAVRESVGELAPICKALGDSTRLLMAAVLVGAGRPLCVCELETYFDLSQPTISHHLAVLRKAKVVCTERRGTWVYYAIDPGAVQGVRNLAGLVLGDCCRDPKG
ncbi:transcriptional regulator [bacterium CG_4_9_14_3_um_filter_65_15]|nr:MAG: transcriptional regulator [bacterium CG_4_9_14_3_um_filter_65_15]